MINQRRSVAAMATLALCSAGLAIVVASRNDLATGPLGVPVHAADVPCVNSRPDEVGRTEPANDAYLDDGVIDWALADPSEADLDGALISAGLEEAARSPTLLSLLIARHGRLVVERYFHGATATQSRNLHSATKSILGVVTGAAIDEGFLPTLGTPIGDLVVEAAGTEVGDVTVEQLLSMSGGLATGLNEANLVRDVAARPLSATPGSRWEYSDASSELVALALERAVPGGLCRYTHRLLGPLGITVDHWHLNEGGGVTGRAYAFLTPRELARFGQLVIQRGEWNGAQLIPTDWFDTMLTPRFDIDGGPYRGPGACVGGEARRAYGLHWRIFEVAGQPAWTAAGYGGQFLVVIPSLDLVMVATHDTFHDAAMPVQRHLSPHDFLESFVVPGMVDVPTDAAACGHDLVVAEADGDEPRVLAPHPADDFLAEWSPDGSRIAFVSGRDLNGELYTVDRDGSHLDRLTFDWASDILPRWSPQGNRIAFLSDRDAASFGSRIDSDVHVLDLASGVVQRVSQGDGDASGFAWSPDGERIVFVRSSARDGLGPLWMVDADGGEPSMLHPGPVGWPSWSPDGTTLAVYTGLGTDPRAPLEIGLLDVASGAVTALGTGADRPTWTGDGTYVVTSIETAAGFATLLFNARSGEQTILAVQPSGRPSPDGAWFLYAERTKDLRVVPGSVSP